MNDIKTMTLPRLVAEYLDVGHSTDGRSLAAIDAELSRRQAMLDAAEGMARAIIGCLEDATTALTAYQQAKGGW